MVGEGGGRGGGVHRSSGLSHYNTSANNIVSSLIACNQPSQLALPRHYKHISLSLRERANFRQAEKGKRNKVITGSMSENISRPKVHCLELFRQYSCKIVRELYMD